MRFPTATIFFLVIAFIMFIGFAVMSFVIGETSNALGPSANQTLSSYSEGRFDEQVDMLTTGFGLASLCLFIVAGISYVVDCLRDEHEHYWEP